MKGFVEMEEKNTKMMSHDVPLRFVKMLNVICMTIPFIFCWYSYFRTNGKKLLQFGKYSDDCIIHDCLFPFCKSI